MPTLRRGDKRNPNWKPTGFQQATREQQRAWGARGAILMTVTCPHCGKRGGGFAMRRWHFENCPQRPC